MSSTVSHSEVQTLLLKKTPIKMDNNKRLVRTSSLEKIRIICSQQYYILPALLSWLRSSQPLQSSTEKTIFFFRSLLFSHFLYKLYQIDFRKQFTTTLVLLQRLFNSPKVLKCTVFVTMTVLMLQLGTCFYVLCCGVPSGLVFLVLCLFLIIYLNVKSGYLMKRSVIKKKAF